MYSRDFEMKILSQKTPPNFWLFFGDDKFSMEYYADAFLEKFPTENLKKLYFEEWDAQEAAGHLEGAGLFGSNSVLRAKFESKPKFKELQKVVEKCYNNRDNIFVCEVYSPLSKSEIENEMKAVFGENFLRLFVPDSAQKALASLRLAAKKCGVKADDAALVRIYELQNEDLFLSVAELNKVATLREYVDLEAVNELVFTQNVISFQQFFNSFLNQNDIGGKSLLFLQEINGDEVRFFKRLFREFYFLFRIFAAMQISPQFSFKEAIGYEPPISIANELKRNATKLNLRDYRRVFAFLNEAELNLMTKRDKILLTLMLELKMILSNN